MTHIELYGVMGENTGQLLTYRGRPLVHDSKQELQWILPKARVVRCTVRELDERSPLPPMSIKDHPALSMLTWPLTKDQFQ